MLLLHFYSEKQQLADKTPKLISQYYHQRRKIMFAYSSKIATLGFLLLGAAGAIDDSSSPSADSSIDRRHHLQGDNDRPTPVTRRQTLQARTTLLNVDIENLTPDEIIFFEDCWKEVYNKTKSDGNDDTTVRSVVVEGQDDTNDNRRRLNGDKSESRSLYFGGYIFNPPTFYFDIWTVIEISCGLCYDGDRLLKGGSLRGEGKKNMDMLHGRNQQFEGAFCDKLREGPYKVFNDVEDCRVVYMAS
jgi:hypothetical protein